MSDQLHYVVVESHRDRLHTQQWPHDQWPPPAKLFLLVGRTLGITAIITEENLATIRGTDADLDEIYRVTEVIKVRQSKLPEDHGMSFVAPSAMYVPTDEVEEKWWE